MVGNVNLVVIRRCLAGIDGQPRPVHKRWIGDGGRVDGPVGAAVVGVSQLDLQGRHFADGAEINAVRARQANRAGYEFDVAGGAWRGAADGDIYIADIATEDAGFGSLHEGAAAIVGARGMRTTGLPRHPHRAVGLVDGDVRLGGVGLSGRRDLSTEIGCGQGGASQNE